jgi:hypothetical protein
LIFNVVITTIDVAREAGIVSRVLEEGQVKKVGLIGILLIVYLLVVAAIAAAGSYGDTVDSKGICTPMGASMSVAMVVGRCCLNKVTL